MDKVYELQELSVTRNTISFRLRSQDIKISIDQSGSRLLPNATIGQLQVFEIDDDGIGIYWPLLDEDLSVSGLLKSAGREDLIVSDIDSVILEDSLTQQIDRDFEQEDELQRSLVPQNREISGRYLKLQVQQCLVGNEQRGSELDEFCCPTELSLRFCVI